MLIILSLAVNADYYKIYPHADSYAKSGTWNNLIYINDTNLATGAFNGVGETGNHYGNWTKPAFTTDEWIIEFKDGAGHANYSSKVYDYNCTVDPLQLWATARAAQLTYLYCMNTTGGWRQIRSASGGGFIYEYRVYRELTFNFSNYNFTDCTGAHAGKDVILNLTIFDEEDPTTRLNATIDAYFNYNYNDTVWINYTLANNGSSSYLVCVDDDENETFQVNAEIRYKTDYGYDHRYYIVNGLLGNKTTNISLYNFDNQYNKSELRLDIRNASTFLISPNIYVWLERKYPSENLYRLVQMDKSGDYGLTIFNIVEKSVDYRLKFFDSENHLLKQTSELKFACNGGICEKTALVRDYSGSAISSDLNVIHNLPAVKAGSTDILSINWSDGSGVTSNFRVEVIKITSIQDLVICAQNVSAASGSILCNLENYTGSFALRLFASASPEDPLILEWFERATQDLAALLESELGSSGKQEAILFGVFIDLIMIGAGMLGGVVGVLIMIILSAIVKAWLGFMILPGIIGTITIASIAIFAVFLLKRQNG